MPSSPASPADPRRALVLTRAGMVAERLARAFWLPASLLIIAAVALAFGLADLLPGRWWLALAVSYALLLLVTGALALRRMRWPSRAEALARLEGLERGPAGNVALAAAIALAQDMDADQTIVVQETEYAGAGKQPSAQLSFARDRGVEIRRGDPDEEIPGASVVIPEHPSQLRLRDVDLSRVRKSLIRKAAGMMPGGVELNAEDIGFLAAETRSDHEFVQDCLRSVSVS